MADAIFGFWHRHPGFRFWTGESTAGPLPLQDICDGLYSLHLLGRLQHVLPDAAARFVTVLDGVRLAGRIGRGNDAAKPINPHLTAYALGTLNLLAQRMPEISRSAIASTGWQLQEIIDPATGLPKWPKAWSHHSWRVSHWVGGSCSIMGSLARLAPAAFEASGVPTPLRVLEAADALIDPRSGFLRCYGSDFLHALFNTAYALRHRPLAGEVGGIVHVHWVNHALGRHPFKGAVPLHAASLRLLNAHPFIEKTPYCLDFDVIQIARTTAAGAPTAALQARAQQYAADTLRFLSARPPEGYGIHRLPGALAVIHEAALIGAAAEVDGLGIAPIDIIRDALWI